MKRKQFIFTRLLNTAELYFFLLCYITFYGVNVALDLLCGMVYVVVSICLLTHVHEFMGPCEYIARDQKQL